MNLRQYPEVAVKRSCNELLRPSQPLVLYTIYIPKANSYVRYS